MIELVKGAGELLVGIISRAIEARAANEERRKQLREEAMQEAAAFFEKALAIEAAIDARNAANLERAREADKGG